VGIEFQHAGTPSIGLDADGRTPSANFVELNGVGWQESSVSGDFVLRTTYVPEPGTTVMLVAGIACLAAMGRRRLRQLDSKWA
jgi:hypothetical protein